jgi:hypothetical protein
MGNFGLGLAIDEPAVPPDQRLPPIDPQMLATGRIAASVTQGDHDISVDALGLGSGPGLINWSPDRPVDCPRSVRSDVRSTDVTATTTSSIVALTEEIHAQELVSSPVPSYRGGCTFSPRAHISTNVSIRRARVSGFFAVCTR